MSFRRVVVIGALAALGSSCSRKQHAPAPPSPPASATALSGAVEVALHDAGVASAADASASEKEPSGPRPLAGKKVLHVGDSMVGGKWGLTRALEAKLAPTGATIVRHTKVSESLTSFDRGPTLKDLLRTHDPDIIVI